MNLTKFIENLQNKPKIVRIQILIGAVFISMVFITWVWIESLNLSSPPAHQEAPPKGTGQASEKSAFEQLREVGGDAFKSLEELKGELKDLEGVKGHEQEKIEPVKLPVE